MYIYTYIYNIFGISAYIYIHVVLYIYIHIMRTYIIMEYQHLYIYMSSLWVTSQFRTGAQTSKYPHWGHQLGLGHRTLWSQQIGRGVPWPCISGPGYSLEMGYPQVLTWSMYIYIYGIYIYIWYIYIMAHLVRWFTYEGEWTMDFPQHPSELLEGNYENPSRGTYSPRLY